MRDSLYATRRSRQGESWLKRSTAYTFYRTIGSMSRVPIPPDTGDFRLLNRRVVEVLKQMPERNRFMKGLFAWVGFQQTSVSFVRFMKKSSNAPFIGYETAMVLLNIQKSSRIRD